MPAPFEKLLKRVPAPAKAAIALLAMWGVSISVGRAYNPLGGAVLESARRSGWIGGPAFEGMSDALYESAPLLGWSLLPLLCLFTLAVPAAFTLRMLARARARAGLSDPVARAAVWTNAHPKTRAWITALPALYWLLSSARHAILYCLHWDRSFYGEVDHSLPIEWMRAVHTTTMGTFGVGMAIASLAVYGVSRASVGAFLTPTLEAEEEQPAVPVAERVDFDAVAVTRETLGAVAFMAILPVIVVAVTRHLEPQSAALVFGTYATFAVAGALVFRRASRITVGVDGIFVTGSSRSRFFPYRDIDAVRTRGSDIQVARRGRVILRLQLHGEDARQRHAIVRRIGAAIKVAKERATAHVGDLVATASADTLARAVQGAEGYRSASVSREQLWSLVEGPEHEAAARISAGRALAATGGDGDRERLRVAASRSAEPRVRVDLEELSVEPDIADLQKLRAR